MSPPPPVPCIRIEPCPRQSGLCGNNRAGQNFQPLHPRLLEQRCVAHLPFTALTSVPQLREDFPRVRCVHPGHEQPCPRHTSRVRTAVCGGSLLSCLASGVLPPPPPPPRPQRETHHSEHWRLSLIGQDEEGELPSGTTLHHDHQNRTLLSRASSGTHGHHEDRPRFSRAGNQRTRPLSLPIMLRRH